ncbi:hypothetical protein Bbelb_324480 [Branchiostoma belcheri]|nr:hypothetical protein Bbelb_324480 [Branchiostoma belcheri]
MSHTAQSGDGALGPTDSSCSLRKALLKASLSFTVFSFALIDNNNLQGCFFFISPAEELSTKKTRSLLMERGKVQEVGSGCLSVAESTSEEAGGSSWRCHDAVTMVTGGGIQTSSSDRSRQQEVGKEK